MKPGKGYGKWDAGKGKNYGKPGYQSKGYGKFGDSGGKGTGKGGYMDYGKQGSGKQGNNEVGGIQQRWAETAPNGKKYCWAFAKRRCDTLFGISCGKSHNCPVLSSADVPCHASNHRAWNCKHHLN